MSVDRIVQFRGLRVPRRHAEVVAFFLLVLAVYLPTADYDQQQNMDVVAVAVPVWSVIERGTIDVRPYQDASPWFFEAEGRFVSNRWPGTMAAAFPAYVAAAPWVTADLPALWPATVTAVLLAGGAATALFALVLSMHGPGPAWVAGGTAAFGSGLWTVAADSLWTHAPSVLAIALALHALRTGHQWWAGICFGYLGLLRLHLLAAVAMLGYVLARESRDIRTLLRLGVPSAAGLLLYLIYAGQLTGEGSVDLLPYGFAAPRGWERITNVIGLLAAPRVGLLVYTPVLACCVSRIGQAWREAEAWERAAFVGGLVYLTVQIQGNYFFGGFSFYGYRLPLEGLALVFPMLVRSGVLFARASRARRAVVAVLSAYSMWVSAVGALLFDPPTNERLQPWTTYGPAEVLAAHGVGFSAMAVATGVVLVVAAVASARRMEHRPGWRLDAASE